MRIQHNIPAMNAYRNYNNNTSALSKNLEKLSSGYKINRAGDDAAGLAISEKMRAQITGLEAAQKNVKDGTSLVKTAEGAMQEIHDMLNRMDYLATQSANGTYDNEVDRANLQKEIVSLKSEINRIADSANFNGIKLLDGVSGQGRLSTLPVEYETLSSAAGVTIDSVANGGGTKGEFTIDLNKQFSFGDTITVTGTDADGNALTETYKLSTDTSDAKNFYGDTVEEQATDLVNKMAAKFGAHFDIKADGSKITMTAKAEGVEAAVIDSVATTNASVSIAKDAGNSVPGAVAADGDKYVGAFQAIGGVNANGAGNIEVGDKLTFEFADANGNKLEATIIADAEMASANAATATEALVNALNEATFKDNADTTGVDESQIKVKDLFTLTPNQDKAGTANTNGSFKVEGKFNAVVATGSSAVKLTIDRKGAKTTFNADTKTPTTAGTAANSKADVFKTSAVATNNFTAGDKVKLTGSLSDGRTFEVTLEAGKDFDVDKDATDTTAIQKTVQNLAKAFASENVSVTLKNAAGEEVGTMTGKDLFGDKGEFTVEEDNSGLVITSKNKGTAATYSASTITNIEVKALDDVSVTGATQLTKNLAEAQTSATSQFTLDDKLAYGTAIKVGDKTYEVVADARDTSSRNNTAIVVKDLTDSKAVAKSIAAAISENEKGSYTAEADGATVTVKSDKIGSDQVALSVTTPYGDKIKTASFTFDPKAVREGSKLEFNDNTYEFVKKGGTVKNEGAIAIELDDPSKATAKELGDAFAAVVKNGTATVDENGKVTLKGVETEDGKISDPRVTWDNNLVLQIGDTADSFNQLSVKLSDMHTTAMGIDGVDISNQTSAAAAIDVIKDAINYVSSVRGDFGATQNRLEHTANNLSVMAENIQDAESNIRDTDVAAEMMSYVKNNILVQSAQAMLAQANQLPQGVLQLLG